MVAPNYEELIPGLAGLRAEERQRRALAFAGLTSTVCGREVKCLTPLHRLELQLTRNAFAVLHASPLAGDVFQFLWLLSPDRRLDPRRGSLALRFKQWRLRGHVRRLDLAAATHEIYQFLAGQLQDSPESGVSDGPDQSLWIHWIAADATFWMNLHGGFSLGEYLSTPYVVLRQLYRAWRCNHPNIDHDGSMEEPQFINASDQLVNRWQQQHRAALAESIRNRRERRP